MTLYFLGLVVYLFYGLQFRQIYQTPQHILRPKHDRRTYFFPMPSFRPSLSHGARLVEKKLISPPINPTHSIWEFTVLSDKFATQSPPDLGKLNERKQKDDVAGDHLKF